MNKMKIYLSPKIFENLMFITNGENIVNTKTMVESYPEFLGQELMDLIRESNILEFYTC